MFALCEILFKLKTICITLTILYLNYTLLANTFVNSPENNILLINFWKKSKIVEIIQSRIKYDKVEIIQSLYC